MRASVLIALPHGCNASGVTAWAVRLANALAEAGRAVGLIVHDEPPGQRPVAFEIDGRVERFDARGLPPMDACAGDLSAFEPVYGMALGVMASRVPGWPVVAFPNLLGDCYGVFARLSRREPELVRIVGVHHSDLRYNDAVLAHYAPSVHAFVGVSERIGARLRRLAPTRGPDVFTIGYGVEVPPGVMRREPLAGRPVRLLYAGRLDHEQKRIGALGVMAEELRRAGVRFELAVLGDGPGAPEVRRLAGRLACVRVFGAAPPAGVRAALDAADLFVLPSRYEGLSVALLEAMAHGCVPVLTPSRSGTGQLVADGRTGFLASAGPEHSAERAGAAMSAAVVRAVRSGDAGLHGVRVRGWGLVRERFSAGLCAARYAGVIDHAARAMPRPWPKHRPAAFTGPGGGGSGTVPADAPARIAAALGSLGAGARAAVYGVGRHTLELREAIEACGCRVVAFLDDDPARAGGELWGRPVVRPAQAAGLGVTDIVLSSWLHESEMAARCGGIPGVRVHRLYATEGASGVGA